MRTHASVRPRGGRFVPPRTFFPLARVRFGRGVWVVIVFFLATLAARAAGADGDDREFRLAIIVMRHGVRSQVSTNEEIGRFAAQPWPCWEVPPGYLTPHGRHLMVLLGAYYRETFAAQGLLTGRTDEDLKSIYFRADSDERTVETARGLGLGLLPGAEPVVHAKAEGRIDPLFHPVGRPDRALAAAAVRGRIGDNPAILGEANKPLFEMMQRVLFDGEMTPPGKISPFVLPVPARPDQTTRAVDLRPLSGTVAAFAEAFLLEYADGLPPQDVGWGRITPEMITQLLRLHSLYFDLIYRTFYQAQAEGSNLASHLLATLEQAASGQAVPGAIGGRNGRLVVLVGHDGNVASLGGLLGISWRVPGSQEDPVFPGGGLVFELHRHRDGRFFVRTSYVAQTLDQMRFAPPLTPSNPPARAPIFVPGCSRAGPGFDAPLEQFEALLRRVIDPDFTDAAPDQA